MDDYKQIYNMKLTRSARYYPISYIDKLHKDYSTITQNGPLDPTRGYGYYNDFGKTQKCAFVSLMMIGDAYTPGAVVLGESFRKIKTKYQLIMMVTPDVSQRSRNAMLTVWDKIIEVPYITCVNIYRSNKLIQYDHWITKSFTKFNILKLVEYDKVMFIEPDEILIYNIDHLFELPTPSGIFTNFSSYPFDYRTVSPYWSLKHGEYVQPWMVPEAFHNYGHGPIGGRLIVKPDIDLLNYMLFEISKIPNFGYKTSYGSGIDEIAFAWFYSIKMKYPMYHIHPKYGWVPWKKKMIFDSECDKIYVHHFFGVDKPWLCCKSKYTDNYWLSWWCTLQQWVNNQSNDNQYFIQSLIKNKTDIICSKILVSTDFKIFKPVEYTI